MPMPTTVELTPLTTNSELPVNASEAIIDKEEGIDDGFSKPAKPHPETTAPKPDGRRPLDINLYATKKTIAQGMMDLALLTANSNQLRYVLESGDKGGAYFYISVSLISLSIILQLIVAIGLIFLGRYNMDRSHTAEMANRLNNWITLGILLITVTNIFISAFAMHHSEGINPELLIDVCKQSTGPVSDAGSL